MNNRLYNCGQSAFRYQNRFIEAASPSFARALSTSWLIEVPEKSFQIDRFDKEEFPRLLMSVKSATFLRSSGCKRASSTADQKL